MKKPIYKRLWFWLVIIVVVIIIVGGSAGGNSNNNSNNTDNSSISDGATVGERMALSSAKNYLSIMGFSKKGLIEQLEFEGYSTAEATYAANNCGANWNEQAVKVAKNYLNTMPFSRKELKDQLIFEGFTESEATYGVNEAYK